MSPAFCKGLYQQNSFVSALSSSGLLDCNRVAYECRIISIWWPCPWNSYRRDSQKKEIVVYIHVCATSLLVSAAGRLLELTPVGFNVQQDKMPSKLQLTKVDWLQHHALDSASFTDSRVR